MQLHGILKFFQSLRHYQWSKQSFCYGARCVEKCPGLESDGAVNQGASFHSLHHMSPPLCLFLRWLKLVRHGSGKRCRFLHADLWFDGSSCVVWKEKHGQTMNIYHEQIAYDSVEPASDCDPTIHHYRSHYRQLHLLRAWGWNVTACNGAIAPQIR